MKEGNFEDLRLDYRTKPKYFYQGLSSNGWWWRWW